MSKNLVYYCVGKENIYIEMLRFSIFTLKNINTDLDVLIITNYEKLQIDLKIDGVDFFYVDEETPKKLKTRIFEYPNLSNYLKIIYLDCDIVVNTLMYRLFDRMVDDEKIYVPVEHFEIESHNLPQFGLENYTDEEINFFRENGAYPFNSGTIGFFNTNEMKKNFENLRLVIDQNYGKSKYVDQPSMNMYFNNRLLANYTVFETNKNYFYMDWNDQSVDYLDEFDGIYHFYSYSPSKSDKLKTMIVFYFINEKQ